MFNVLLVSMFTSVIASAIDHRFYTYPTGFIPSADTGDYSLFNASTLIPEVNKDDVLEAYQYSTNFRGFIFDEYDNVTKVLAKVALGTNFTNDWGQLVRGTTEGSYFMEQVPVSNDNQIFMYKFFDFTKHVDKVPDGYKCLIGVNDAECTDIPRCMGYIEDECLVSSISRNNVLVVQSGAVFHEKKRVHDSIKGIKDNFILFWFLYGTAVVALFKIPTMLHKILNSGIVTEKSSYKIRDMY